MHELSIAQNIVSIANHEMKKNHAREVLKIELDIGALCGIEIDCFDFVWPVATKGSVLERTRKVINHIDGKARCEICNNEYKTNHFYEACPNCGSYRCEIIQGRELKVKNLEISY